jgi:hypothetical protein
MKTMTHVFLSRINAGEQIKFLTSINTGIEYDFDQMGWWILRGSPAHSMAHVLGLKLYDHSNGRPQLKIPQRSKIVV